MSQVNFFMLEPDETEFLEMVRARGDVLFYQSGPFDSPDPKPIASLPSFTNGGTFTLLLPGIAPPLDEAAGKYSFGMYTHPIIEYSRSYFDNHVLVSGRIYAKIGWLKPSENNKAYKSCYSSLERWLKKRYIKVHQEWWVAPEAREWSLNGGLLALGSPLALKITLSG